MNSWEDYFSRLTYKPGFSFDYEYKIDFNQHFVTLTMKVVDSRDPKAHMPDRWVPLEGRRLKLIPVTMTNRLPPWTSEKVADDYTRYLLRNLEMHELDEWFRKDGDLINDPHADEMAFNRAG